MNAERLIALYERIADAPGAVVRLRRLILDLAVRGKIAPQSPLEVSPEKVGEAPPPDVPPYQLPASWRWVRIGDQLELLNGMAFKPSDWRPEGLRIVRIQNLNNKDAAFNHCDPALARDRSLISDGSFLISWSGTPGSSFGAFIWQRGPAVLNQHIFRCDFKTTAYDAKYLEIAINGRLDEMIAKAHGGVGLQHITKGKLEGLLISLPPLAEQRRIVATVGELMSLCDRLEAARAEREAARDRLTAASHAILNTPEAEQLPANVRIALDALPALTARPDQVKQLHHTILTLAVQGRLLAQDMREGVADTVEKLKKEQISASKKGAIKSSAAAATLFEGDIPFEIPGSWSWVCLGNLLSDGPRNGISPRPSNDPSSPKAITLTATTSGIFDGQYFKHVEGNFENIDELWLKSGDLLFQRGNTPEYVGMAAYYDGLPGQFIYPDLMIKVRLLDEVDLRYVHMCSISPYARQYLSRRASGAQATMPKINQGDLLALPIPLPPLGEQQRIVVKVDELAQLCNQLIASLAGTGAMQQRLLEALLQDHVDNAVLVKAA